MMKKEISVYHMATRHQAIMDEKTYTIIDPVEWLDLIGAEITRIRQVSVPESHLIFTLKLKD